MQLNYDELQLLMQKYLPTNEIEQVQKAYFFAKNAHEGQIRKSGEPYIIHPIAVAIILASQNLPATVIIAGLLHDVVEDTEIEKNDIIDSFGQEVAIIVEGVTKLGNIKGLSNDFVQAENHRKIILATSKDIRVIMVKLADRIHNMRTIKHMNEAKQKLIANETLEVYAPIAHRLGMYQMKWELEDLSLRCINRTAYDEIADKINMKRSEREEMVKSVVETTSEFLQKRGIDVKIYGRTKHIYSIYQKIVKKEKSFDELMDLYAFRIIVSTIPECYTVLGAIHEFYKPIPLKFKDYIPTPKHNMYQSIHTTVVSNLGIPIEFQIRTNQMDITAERGIASHWMYKENITNEEVQNHVNERISWLKLAAELDEKIDPRAFMDHVKSDYFSKNLIVYTPKGDVVEIPEGSTVLDFGYYVHTKVGNKAVSAIVNDKVVSLFYRLEIGDIVQIITNDLSQPSLSYISKVKTSRARESLKKYFKDSEKRQIQIEGKKTLIKFAIDEMILDIEMRLKNPENKNWYRAFGSNSTDDFYYAIGMGDLDINQVIGYFKNDIKKVINSKDVVIENAKIPYMYRLCKYCSPIPGDELHASLDNVINNINEYSVHRKNCRHGELSLTCNFTKLSLNKMYIARLSIMISDEKNSVAKVLNMISKLDYNVTSIYFRGAVGETAFGRVSIEVNNRENLDNITNHLINLSNVISLERIIDINETT